MKYVITILLLIGTIIPYPCYSKYPYIYKGTLNHYEGRGTLKTEWIRLYRYRYSDFIYVCLDKKHNGIVEVAWVEFARSSRDTLKSIQREPYHVFIKPGAYTDPSYGVSVFSPLTDENITYFYNISGERNNVRYVRLNFYAKGYIVINWSLIHRNRR